MFLRRSTLIKYFVAVLIGAAAYCEWFVYKLQPYYWADFRCHSQDPTCTKVLFIADPQIQGDYEFPPPLNYLFEWDADRYLRSTFSAALQYFRPDVLVYLGDLMDEGSISTNQQYHGYVKRLSEIFQVDYPIMQIWLPGDNDIGGENESIKKDKIEEFNKVFHQPLVITFRDITFYKVNGITHNYPPKVPDQKDETLTIVLSHYSLTKMPIFGKQVHEALEPQIYFSAHDHESKIITQDATLNHRLTNWYKYGDPPIVVNFSENDELYEISVPTCSYRMGTDKIGFGAAVIGNNNHHMRYTVLWSPSRFPYLFVYLLFLIIALLYFCTFVWIRMYLACSKTNLSTSSSTQFSSVVYEKVCK